MIEIGIGNGFVSTFLKSSGICVKTFDINPNLNPDIVAPVHRINDFVKPGEFDLISCCEVLEHLPFKDFEAMIETFSNLSDRLFLTLPVFGKHFGFGGVVHLPRFHQWLGLWLKFSNKKGIIPNVHFWEIDYNRRTSKKKIIKILEKYYLYVESGSFKGNPHHQYFKCNKLNKTAKHFGGVKNKREG